MHKKNYIMSIIKVDIMLLHDNATCSFDKDSADSGYDLCTPVGISLPPFVPVKVPLGIAIQGSNCDHYALEIQLRPRSSVSAKGICFNVGTIDLGYTGEICAVMVNCTLNVIDFAAGDRIAQLVFGMRHHVQLDIVDTLKDTLRGSGGFGSTGA